MVPGGETVAHQLPGGSSGLPRCEMLCQRQERRFTAAEVGQYLSRALCEQARRHSLAETECHCERTVALVHGERHHPDCGAPTGRPEYDSGRGVPRDEGRTVWMLNQQIFARVSTPVGAHWKWTCLHPD